MVQPDVGIQSGPASKFGFDREKIEKNWRQLEIPHFAVRANSCSGCVVNLDGPRRSLQ
jgi:hypothetical protein